MCLIERQELNGICWDIFRYLPRKVSAGNARSDCMNDQNSVLVRQGGVVSAQMDVKLQEWREHASASFMRKCLREIAAW